MGGVAPRERASTAAFQVEFLTTAGTYSETSHQSLSALCSGPAAHHLKIHYTDLRNQDDSVRDSGDATFDVCNNINNTGRDAPRHVRAGNVYDEYIVSGVPVYTSGHQDPLLYDQAIIDTFTKASDGVSAGDVRWVIHNHNSWENVAAGSTGNAGNPGPAGFAKTIRRWFLTGSRSTTARAMSLTGATSTQRSPALEQSDRGRCGCRLQRGRRNLLHRCSHIDRRK